MSTGTGIAGAMDYVPAGQAQVGACVACGKVLTSGYAARVKPPLIEVCSKACAADPKFTGQARTLEGARP